MSEVAAAFLEDASGFRGHAEHLIVPDSAEHAAKILAEAHSLEVPVTIAGAGTGVTGGRVAQGGWVLSTAHLTSLEIGDGWARAGAGVLLRDLQKAAAATGQFYAPDPTEWSASVGGTVATNASGSRSFQYGATRRHLRRLTVATMDGRLRDYARGDAIDFDVPALPQPRTTKTTAGYPLEPGMDWIDLFTGSEGTLGVVTAAEVALLPAPRQLLTGVVFFEEDTPAVHAVDAWRPIKGLRMLEYLDRPSLDLLRPKFSDVPREAGAALLIEQEVAHADAADEWIERLEAACALTDSSWFALTAGDRERFRQFRHALPEMVNDTVRRRGFTKLGSDYAVPIDRNLEMLSIYRARLEAEFAGRHVIFGHIGDAHLHANILAASAAEFDRGRELMIELAREAVRLGGTVSAEHGLGKRKAHLLALQFSPDHIEAMRAVKRRLDPKWLLGQGNLFAALGVG